MSFRSTFPSLRSFLPGPVRSGGGWATLGVLALLLGGCPSLPTYPPVVDQDGDQWLPPEADCDDTDPEIHRYADERCDGVDNDCDGEIDEDSAIDTLTFYADADMDGYGSASYTIQACTPPAGYVDNILDCGDLDPEIRPGAIEICDEIDNNCNGEIDEDGAAEPSFWYEDDDNDGYGNPASRVQGCMPPEGYVGDNTDCDDERRFINPGAPEVCDEDDFDEDCDGTTDDLDDSATGQFTWYPDGDLDGYGTPGATLVTCEQPESYAPTADDCDDLDRNINPGSREVCGDGADNDCDGLVDGEDDARDVPFWADLDEDGFGDDLNYIGDFCDIQPLASAEPGDCDDTNAAVNPAQVDVWYDGVDADCSGEDDYDADFDGFPSADHGGDDCDDVDPAINPGVPEICGDGADNDCDGVVDACDVSGVLRGASAGDTFGASVAGIGDINGDGIGDVLVGADREDTNGAGAGAAYLFFGPLSGDRNADDADAFGLGLNIGDHFGGTVAATGDVTGDGVVDFAVGAYGTDTGAADAGTVYVFAGPVSGEFEPGDAVGRFDGEAASDQAGWSIAGAGDVDGDGVGDLVTAAWSNDDAGAESGAVYLFFSPVTGVYRLWSADARLTGEAAGDQAGWSVSAGDLDADGLSDVVIGAPYEHSGGLYSGAAYIVSGTPRGSFGLDEADARIKGLTSGDQAGTAVASGADINDDGYADLLMGSPGNDLGGNSSGAAYLLLGPLSGNRTVSIAQATFIGEDNDDLAGSSLSFAPDLDGDGLPEILIGARDEDSGASNAGAAYILRGLPSGSASLRSADGKIAGSSVSDWVGYAVSGSPDLDGDGTGDVLFAGPFRDPGGDLDAGEVWIIPGGGWP